MVYTRRSGNTRFVEIELVFDSNSTLSTTAAIEKRIRAGLSEHFPDLTFRLISLTSGMGMRASN